MSIKLHYFSADNSIRVHVNRFNKIMAQCSSHLCYFTVGLYHGQRKLSISDRFQLHERESVSYPNRYIKFPLEDLTVVTTGMCCVKLRIMKRGAVMGLDCLIPERRAALREGTDQYAACLRFVETASISRSSLMATARSFPKAHAHLKRVEIKITLRAAIRAVIRILRAEKLELRISTFKRKLWRQATETDVKADPTQFAGLTLHKALGKAGKHVSKAAGEVVNRKGNLAGLLTIGEQPASPKAAEPPALLPAFAPGDRVMHDKRGPGTDTPRARLRSYKSSGS